MSVLEVLAIVPARGGSKSIPRKNLRPLAGHPLLAYSIAAGLATTRVTRVLVSTDDEEIASVARHYGAEVPFLRPAELAQDLTPDLPVFQHALTWLRDTQAYEPALVVHLRPTSPFRSVQQIDDCVDLLLARPQADAVRSVCLPTQNPFKMWRLSAEGWMRPIGTELGVAHEPYNQPRQALPEIYWHNGYVDAIRASTILVKNSMTGDHVWPLIMDPGQGVDIDTPEDWRHAESLLENGAIQLAAPGQR